jgi:threonine dehydratase
MCCIAPRTRLLVLHGSLITFRRRCGKASCRCATGEAHESPAFTYTNAGRTKTVTLSDAEVVEVAAALARYESARAELEDAAQVGVAALLARRASRSGSGERR